MMNFDIDTDVTIEQEQIRRDVHDHEVFLSFTDDVHAYAFEEWLKDAGFSSFKEWLVKHGGRF